MSKSFKNDLRGQRFGRLTVLEFVPTEDKISHWLCKCDCGNITTVAGKRLRNGHTQSCGCLQTEQAAKRLCKHGMCKSRLYGIWSKMKIRCYNHNNSVYKHYGGRGIKVCDEWKLSFETFYQWAISNGYEEGLSIDRINVNGNYEPSNCRWVGTKEQSRNKRNTIMLEYEGRVISLAEAAELSGIKYATLRHRYYAGLRGEELFRPPQEHKKVK